MHKNPGCVIVGTFGFDDIITPCESKKHLLGGSAFFSAIAASRFGEVSLVASAGYDFTESEKSVLLGQNIDLEGLQLSTSQPTFYWKGQYGDDFASRNTITLEENALNDFKPCLKVGARTAPYALLANMHPGYQLEAMRQLSPETVVLLDTIDYWILNERKTVHKLIEHASIVIINDEELKLLTGECDQTLAANTVLNMGPYAVIIKSGTKGSHLYVENAIHHVGVWPNARLVDPTGAGDSFAGAVLGCLAKYSNLNADHILDAMRWGSAVASFTVESFSADVLLNTSLTDIEYRYEQIKAGPIPE